MMNNTTRESDPLLSSKKKTNFRIDQNDSPIAEDCKPNESYLQRQASIISDPDVLCGRTFRAGLMIIVFSIHWLVSALICVTGLCLVVYPPGHSYACHVYFAIVYLRMTFWVATYVLHESIKPSCRLLINQNYNLYQDMTCYRKAPLQIVSFWNIILLAIQANIQTLFAVSDSASNICDGVPNITELSASWNISPQLFISIFCCLETIALACFYIPAIKRLTKSLRQQSEEDSPDRTLSNQDDISINQRLKRQAEQVKILRVANVALKKEAIALGALDADE
ncbi:uncharacterized protein LOC129719121 [Wyeomyia smithii]|uniref:uncharacterized protein LOC129719121 n=1 Tax=Wyeomyia smithii TaxID=174621 RepID=UPI002467E6E4|nr:uncharacterized protein LOC129719121 [Wyeomyia smithii]